jgi:hypothetical protein
MIWLASFRSFCRRFGQQRPRYPLTRKQLTPLALEALEGRATPTAGTEAAAVRRAGPPPRP